MERRKGFTLIELLLCVSILGVITIIIITNMQGSNNAQNERLYEEFINNVKTATSIYIEDNNYIVSDLYVGEGTSSVTIPGNVLVDEGYLDKKFVNPYTNKPLGATDLIVVTVGIYSDFNIEVNIDK